MSVLYRAIVTVDGTELQSVEDSVSFKAGLAVAKPRKGPRGYVGSGVMPGMAELSLDVIPVAGFDPETLSKGREVTARVFDDYSNQEWVCPKLVLTEDSELTTGENAAWKLKLEGASAEKVK